MLTSRWVLLYLCNLREGSQVRSAHSSAPCVGHARLAQTAQQATTLQCSNLRCRNIGCADDMALICSKHLQKPSTRCAWESQRSGLLLYLAGCQLRTRAGHLRQRSGGPHWLRATHPVRRVALRLDEGGGQIWMAGAPRHAAQAGQVCGGACMTRDVLRPFSYQRKL